MREERGKRGQRGQRGEGRQRGQGRGRGERGRREEKCAYFNEIGVVVAEHTCPARGRLRKCLGRNLPRREELYAYTKIRGRRGPASESERERDSRERKRERRVAYRVVLVIVLRLHFLLGPALAFLWLTLLGRRLLVCHGLSLGLLICPECGVGLGLVLARCLYEPLFALLLGTTSLRDGFVLTGLLVRALILSLGILCDRGSSLPSRHPEGLEAGQTYQGESSVEVDCDIPEVSKD
jgi:hypothetical protein